MTLFFSHIPKSAGTTFRNILINNYSIRHIDWYHKKIKTKASPKVFPFNSGKVMRQLKSISGHWLRYDTELHFFFPKVKYITFVRDPVSRFISLYFHIIRTWDPELKFNEWTLGAGRPELNNFQTHFIAGSEDLETAKKILKNNFFFVGKAERFDESLCLLKNMIDGPFDIRYEPLRVSKHNKEEFLNNEKNFKAFNRLRANNTLDLKLNDFIEEELFPLYKKKYGYIQPDFLKLQRDNVNFKFNRLKKGLFVAEKKIFINPLLHRNN